MNYFWDEVRVPGWFERNDLRGTVPGYRDWPDPYTTTQGGLWE